MGNKYKLGRTCLTCGSRITDHNKTGYCNYHRDRTGSNNPFFGKTHSSETISKLVEICRQSSKEKWRNQNYREKIIKAVSKPRRSGFKEEQSKRIKKWFDDNPIQKQIRSDAMRKNWKDGKLIHVEFSHTNKSKVEIEFYNALNSLYPVTRRTIRTEDGWYFPDCTLIKEGIIIEFFGDYWHGNPKKYKDDDVVAHGRLAKDIWERDAKRIRKFEDLGYKVIIIWHSEYKQNKDVILKNLETFLDWESCAL